MKKGKKQENKPAETYYESACNIGSSIWGTISKIANTVLCLKLGCTPKRLYRMSNG